MQRIAVFGGVYSNYLALERCLEDAHVRGAEAIYCLGDLGGCGPFPERVFPLLIDADVQVVQGNYDHSIGHDRDDCACGYTDPLDNYFARVSYEYTQRQTPVRWKPWLRSLPPSRRVRLGRYQLHLCHGSPRRTNEFVWESTASTAFLDRLVEQARADVAIGTHTGLHWARRLPGRPGPDRWWINAGAIGRPANDGGTHVWYTLLDASQAELSVQFVPLDYDHERLAAEIEAESLPAEFAETVRTGWWTTCLEVLPMKERRRGRH
ncbi:MAG: metallophosphoesterase family protein [Longimicrobiales bacterium]